MYNVHEIKINRITAFDSKIGSMSKALKSTAPTTSASHDNFLDVQKSKPGCCVTNNPHR